jgi:diaminopimelate epimerase
MKFAKYHGLGNDYLVINQQDGRESAVDSMHFSMTKIHAKHIVM